MTVAEKLTAIAENEKKVYEAGKQAIFGKMDSLSYFFTSNYNMDALQTILNSDLSGVKRCQYTFMDNTMLTEFSAPETLRPIWMNGMFQRCTSLVRVSGFDKIPFTGSITDVFNGCTGLVDAGTINFTGIIYANRTFQDCTSLEHIEITGTIGVSVDFHWSPLTHDSLMSVIHALQTSVTGLTCTLGTTNLAKLTDTEKAIATERGWTLA